MDATTVAALLGRPLTSVETDNFQLYLKIARQSLDDLLCTNLCDESSTRTFQGRDGYVTIFTDIFHNITEVKLNGDVTTDYTPYQWDRSNGGWFNSLVFDHKLDRDDEIEIVGAWGFETMPADLKLVLANLFALITAKNKFDGTIESKWVEDFRVTFKTDADLDDEFYNKYNRTIAKYSMCDVDGIRHGEVRYEY